MSAHQYMTYSEDGHAFVTAFLPEVASEPLTASTSSHPNYAEIVCALADGLDADYVADLFSVERAVAKKFDSLSERVSVANGRVYIDGDEVDNALTRQITRFLSDGIEDWHGLVAFFENVLANPSDNSREQLYTWLADRDFTITPEGNFLAYKGLRSDLTSVQSGPGIVNGEEVNGHLDNTPGNVVEIARSYVVDDAGRGCARGLHVGTHNYARGWAQSPDSLVLVEVNPRDVVSVPTDCNAQKVRVCRYTVIDRIVDEVDVALYERDEDPDDFEYDYCEECFGPCEYA